MCLLAVGMAWFLTHTSYALRYAHLYYRDDEEGIGGLEFPCNTQPAYFDFAYFSFTVGMCFQVSDTELTGKRVRRTALHHALLSYLYGTVIVAITVNSVAGLLGR
jgi:uncharacterized membrane protein